MLCCPSGIPSLGRGGRHAPQAELRDRHHRPAERQPLLARGVGAGEPARDALAARAWDQLLPRLHELLHLLARPRHDAHRPLSRAARRHRGPRVRQHRLHQGGHHGDGRPGPRPADRPQRQGAPPADDAQQSPEPGQDPEDRGLQRRLQGQVAPHQARQLREGSGPRHRPEILDRGGRAAARRALGLRWLDHARRRRQPGDRQHGRRHHQQRSALPRRARPGRQVRRGALREARIGERAPLPQDLRLREAVLPHRLPGQSPRRAGLSGRRCSGGRRHAPLPGRGVQPRAVHGPAHRPAADLERGPVDQAPGAGAVPRRQQRRHRPDHRRRHGDPARLLPLLRLPLQGRGPADPAGARSAPAGPVLRRHGSSSASAITATWPWPTGSSARRCSTCTRRP